MDVSPGGQLSLREQSCCYVQVTGRLPLSRLCWLCCCPRWDWEPENTLRTCQDGVYFNITKVIQAQEYNLFTERASRFRGHITYDNWSHVQEIKRKEKMCWEGSAIITWFWSGSQQLLLATNKRSKSLTRLIEGYFFPSLWNCLLIFVSRSWKRSEKKKKGDTKWERAWSYMSV